MNNFAQEAAHLGFALDKDQIHQFDLYRRLLQEWNQKMDLTNITEDDAINRRHFLDSLSLCHTLSFPLRGRLADIGTGAGFPGIPLKIICPDLSVVLIDSLQKRVRFLEEVIHQLGLQDIQVIHGRAEDLFSASASAPFAWRESFDIAVARAVAPLDVLSEYAIPAVRVGGIFLAMKGPYADQEMMEALPAIELLGGSVEQKDVFEWTKDNLMRTNVVIRKVRPTPSAYPRRAGKAKKSPIGSSPRTKLH